MQPTKSLGTKTLLEPKVPSQTIKLFFKHQLCAKVPQNSRTSKISPFLDETRDFYKT
jgi:hypothetical protein